jgi:maleate isomerase
MATNNSDGTMSITGKLSGKKITIPNVNLAPMPSLASPGVILNGIKADKFGEIDSSIGYPDVKSFKRKFGLLIPATNTSMEYELWSIIFKNQGLKGIGLHTANVHTPKPSLKTKADLLEYKKHFLNGLKAAVDGVLFAQPEYLIMGMSLEHIIEGITEIKAPMKDIEKHSGLSWATWHEAIPVALNLYKAKRIGLITPFDKTGNLNATRMFEDLGFEVVSSVGFSCANALHIAHIPNWAKEKAILELLAKNKLDAIVQCGTNMSMIDVTEKLEPILNIPILGINAVIFWYALRENGFDTKINHTGRIFREF